MPLKLTVGLSRKVGLPNYGSLGATCGLEVELRPRPCMPTPRRSSGRSATPSPPAPRRCRTSWPGTGRPPPSRPRTGTAITTMARTMTPPVPMDRRAASSAGHRRAGPCPAGHLRPAGRGPGGLGRRAVRRRRPRGAVGRRGQPPDRRAASPGRGDGLRIAPSTPPLNPTIPTTPRGATMPLTVTEKEHWQERIAAGSATHRGDRGRRPRPVRPGPGRGPRRASSRWAWPSHAELEAVGRGGGPGPPQEAAQRAMIAGSGGSRPTRSPRVATATATSCR